MKNQFAFLQLSDNISGIAILTGEAKEKKNPFVIVNTDNDRGLYIKNLEKEIAKYKNLKSETGDTRFSDIETSNLIVFGDSPNFDYRIDMNYTTIISLTGKKDVKVYDLVEDYSKIVRRLSTYCKNNGNKRKFAYRNEDVNLRVNINVHEERPACSVWQQRQTKVECPLLANAKRTLINVYSQPKPEVKLEEITVFAYWVKIGYKQYDILVDLNDASECIILEDGQKLLVKEDRFGRRYLAV
jgi:hypothetical protein